MTGSVPSSRSYTTSAATARVGRAGLTAHSVSTYRSQIRTHVHDGKGRGGPGLLVATGPDSQVCSGSHFQIKTAHLRPYLVCGGRQDRGTPASAWPAAAGHTGGRRLCRLLCPAHVAAEQRKLELLPRCRTLRTRSRAADAVIARTDPGTPLPLRRAKSACVRVPADDGNRGLACRASAQSELPAHHASYFILIVEKEQL